MKRITVGPFNRVEGDLEIHLDVAAGVVQEARVNATLYRGFEQMLVGRDPLDALVFAPRVCGICSVAQSYAAASALGNLMGLEVPSNGQLASNLMLASENLSGHLTHFYLFFMPDFAHEDYSARGWHAVVKSRFAAVKGSASKDVLPIRSQLMNVMGILAGRWPHTLTLQPGGSSRPIEPSERIRLYAIIREFRTAVERILFADDCERIAAIDSLEALAAWRDERPGEGDLRHFLEIADDLDLWQWGRLGAPFISYGCYPRNGERLFSRGVWRDGQAGSLDLASVTEDATHAWLQGHGAHAPIDDATLPDADKSGAYTWCKAPRLAGEVVETGALARQAVAGQPLAAVFAAQGGHVPARIICRLLEIARLLPEMERWAMAMVPGERFCVQGTLPDEGQGFGLVEAARGSLGHWTAVHRGRIHNYQIISPTTWNFSPRDAAGLPGPLEQVLAGVPYESSEDRLRVQHLVRAYDPCMVCTVH